MLMLNISWPWQNKLTREFGHEWHEPSIQQFCMTNRTIQCGFVNQIVPFSNFTGIENGEFNKFVPW